VKFSDGRGIVEVRASRAEPGTVVIEVADEGIGIPAEDVPRIFKRFFQVDNTATRRFGGTGMGLALVKRVVQAHGATVDVETRVGLGTRIFLRWPERILAPESAVDNDPMALPVPVQ
jgi:signal transduction histidine kinase